MQLACPGADCDGAEVLRSLRDLRSSEGGPLYAMAIREGTEVSTFENGAQRGGLVARLTCFAAALQNSAKIRSQSSARTGGAGTVLDSSRVNYGAQCKRFEAFHVTSFGAIHCPGSQFDVRSDRGCAQLSAFQLSVSVFVLRSPWCCVAQGLEPQFSLKVEGKGGNLICARAAGRAQCAKLL